MPDRPPVSLSQAFENDIRLHCTGCGHIGYISGQAALALFAKRRWKTWWTTVPNRFRCGKCGKREPSVTAVKLHFIEP